MRRFQGIRNGSMRLPQSGGMGSIEIHTSLLLTLLLLMALTIGLSYARPTLANLPAAAVTLPIIWAVSVVFRVAAQMLALRRYASQCNTVIGPSGNLATDYEGLGWRSILWYAVAGQLATLNLVLLGAAVSALLLEGEQQQLTWAPLLDFHAGWGLRAWASQVFWVNVFVFTLHLLPTVPFDTRAAAFGWFNRGQSNSLDPQVFRRLGNLDSHLAALACGVGLALAVRGLWTGTEAVGWYAALAASMYLLIGSRWEAARAVEVERRYAPLPPALRKLQEQPREGAEPSAYSGNSFDDDVMPSQDELWSGALTDFESAESTAEEVARELLSSTAESPVELDIDDILRKLHREGLESLTEAERQALITASRDLQERREQS